MQGSSVLLQNGVVILGIGVLLSGTVLGSAFYDQVLKRVSVVQTTKVAVKSGPSEALSTLFFLHEGVDIRRIQDVGEWTKIQLRNGFEGWIEETHLEDV